MELEKFYTGWAFDVYPDRGRDYFETEIDKQIAHGSNFVWIGHNNPGEVIAKKDEPALSYAVYEALLDKNDPRHNDAVTIASSQKIFLDMCLEKNIPVVLPIGYQIQMGETWNKNHPKDLRTDFQGVPLDVGHISASIYSNAYRKDIQKYYEWIKENWINPYKKIIILINLADEPFGGDYSSCAEKVFKDRTGLTFAEASSGTDEQKRLLGNFQTNYIVEYAKWSAEAWHKVCPDIPSTMSFCGHHGRDENLMPSIPALFKDTPEYFHPTFDVYPRDGTCAHPITDDDVSMLLIFCRQLAYLSRFYNKPYWLWTTGNSWGLSQACEGDKGNISDCLANQFYAVSTALETGGLLKGIAVWNYNIRNQGLYDDPNPIIYDPDRLFEKITRFLKILREEMANCKTKKYFNLPNFAICLSEKFSDKIIGGSKKVVNIKSFNFSSLRVLAKESVNLVVDHSIDAITEFYSKEKIQYPKHLIYLCDSDEEIKARDEMVLRGMLENSKTIIINDKVASLFKQYADVSNSIKAYSENPLSIDENFITNLFGNNGARNQNLIKITLGHDLILLYNLTKNPQVIDIEGFDKEHTLYIISHDGSIREKIQISSTNKVSNLPIINHHEIAFIAHNKNNLFKKLQSCLK